MMEESAILPEAFSLVMAAILFITEAITVYTACIESCSTTPFNIHTLGIHVHIDHCIYMYHMHAYCVCL